jgi:hypothetical protein
MKIAWSAILARVVMRRQSTPGSVNNMDSALSALGISSGGSARGPLKNAKKLFIKLPSYHYETLG